MSYEEDDRSHLHGYDAKCYALLADPRQMAVPFPQKPTSPNRRYCPNVETGLEFAAGWSAADIVIDAAMWFPVNLVHHVSDSEKSG